MTTRDWLTVKEAAHLAGRSHQTIKTIVLQRRIVAEKTIGGPWLVFRPSLEDYIAYANRVQNSSTTTRWAVHRMGGTLAFPGNGKAIRWDRHSPLPDRWWEDEALLKALEVREEQKED